MRALSPDFLNALRGDRLSFFFLLRLGLDTPLCFTDADHEVYYDDEKYLPVGFKFDSIQGGAGLAVDTLSINIDDTNQVMTSSLLNQDARNKWASIHMGVVTETDVEIDGETHVQTGRTYQLLFRGIIGGWELTGDNMVKVDLTNEMILWNKKPLRLQSTACPWSYRGKECGYKGGMSVCDKTYEACKLRHNEANFGGDRFLAATMVKSVWWGRTQVWPVA